MIWELLRNGVNRTNWIYDRICRESQESRIISSFSLDDLVGVVS